MHERWRLRDLLGTVELELHPAEVSSTSREEWYREATHLLRGFESRSADRSRVLRELYARLHGAPPVVGHGESFGRGQTSEVIGDAILAAVRAGHLAVRRREARAVAVPLDGDGAEAIGPEAEPLAWIEIELVDTDGQPVPGIDYRIECDDGRVRTGTTNLSGKAREEGLHDGNCKVSFPRLHGPDWKAA
jgi:hypothetical protein